MATMSTRITDGGRIVIPAEFRRALGLETGDEIILRLDGGEVRIISKKEAIREAQALVQKHVKGRRSLVKELRDERRREAKRE